MKKEEFKGQEDFMESFEDYMKQNLERIGCGTPFINREIKKRDMQEASGAYKDIDRVIENQLDLIKVKRKLLPVAVIKG